MEEKRIPIWSTREEEGGKSNYKKKCDFTKVAGTTLKKYIS